MALTLMDAAGALQQGLDWKRNRDYQEQARDVQRTQWADEQRLREARNAANAAGAAVISDAQQQWQASQQPPAAAPVPGSLSSASPIGVRGEAPPVDQQTPAPAVPGLASMAPVGAPTAKKPVAWQPDMPTIARAFDARGAALAKAGDWEGFVENEAKSAPIRAQIRSQTITNALSRYGTDQDPIALAQAIYPTIGDGREIKMAKNITGADGKPAIEFSLSDGKKAVMTPDQIVARAKDMLLNPQQVAEYEFKTRLENAKAAAETAGKIQVEQAKGKEDRATEGVKQQGRLSLADVENGYKLGQIDSQNAGSANVAGIHANATIEAAKIHAGVDGPNGGSARIQSTHTDADGYLVGVTRDGNARRLTIDGKPIRSGEWAKRIDAVAKTLGAAPQNFNKKPEELRQMAEKALLNGGGAPQPGPGPGAAPGAPKDYSNLWSN